MIRIINLKKSPQHIEQLARWHQQQWQHFNPEESLHQRIERMQSYLHESFIPSTFIALKGEKLMGSAAIVEHDMNHHQYTPWLASVYVDQMARQQGIGTQLVQYVIQKAKNQNFNKLFLFTPNHQSFYKKMNWQTIHHEEYFGEKVSIMSIQLS